MTDAETLRAQKATSTDPAWLEREAKRADLSFKLDQGPQTVQFHAGNSAHILTITHDGRLERGKDFRTDDEASVALFDCLARAVPCYLSRQRADLEEAKRHIDKLTGFYMDNALWGLAAEAARSWSTDHPASAPNGACDPGFTGVSG